MPQTTTFLDDAILPLGDKDAPPLALTDIYMDDMCLLAQHTHLARMLNTVLHNIEKFSKTPLIPQDDMLSHIPKSLKATQLGQPKNDYLVGTLIAEA